MTTEAHTGAPTRRDTGPLLAATLPALTIALVVAAAAPALRALYPILYVIGEDWSYPGVGAVGLVLYLSPVLAVLAARLQPRTGVLLGAVLVVVATLALVAVDPISRYVAAAATVLVLVGVTVVALHLSATGVARLVLVTGFVLGLALDTAVRGATVTWDLLWHPGLGWSALALVVPVLALVAAYITVRGTPEVARTTSASRSAVVGLGGLVGLCALFLQSPGYASAVAGIPYWAGLLTILAIDVAALLLLPAAPWLRGWVTVLAIALVAAAATAGTAVVTGLWVLPLLAVSFVGLVLLLGTAYAPESHQPGRVHVLAGPARAAGAAVLALLVVFVWQFYIDTALPFPRWVIAVVPALVIGGAALLGTRRPEDAVEILPRVAVRSAVVAAVAALLAVPTVLMGATAVQAQGAAAPSLTLMTYNIRSAADVDGQVRPDVIADVIRASSPDVVVLEEVGRGWPIHAGTDVASVLERDLGYTAYFQGSADDQFGNVVLTRLPSTLVSSGFLPDVGGQRRSYLAVDVDVAGTPLRVVGSHLEDASVEQMTALLDVVGTTTPAVLAGDMNTWPDLPEAATLTSTGLVDVVAATGDKCRSTSAQPARPCDRPDWILVTDDLAVDQVQIGTLPASDHLPLIAHLSLG